MDTLLLSRLQFGFTLSFHILFPTLTIGLAVFLAILEGLWLKTGNPEYKRHYLFWVKIFTLTFGVGVVSGIVLSYEFGTNFSRFSAAAGSIIGPLMSYEVLTAFFMEAGFLGVMLFGWNRVGPKLHFTATLLVALGTMMSAFWIISANSWMQTPAGTVLHDGVFYPVNWWHIVFNPSFPYRVIHMLLAAFLTTSVFVAGVSAWFLLRNQHAAFARRSFVFAIIAAAILAPIQIEAGDQSGLEADRYQPIKVAAIEGRWQSMAGAPLVLVAWPNEKTRHNDFALEIPYASSLIVKHSVHGVVTGLETVPLKDWPTVALVFWVFRIMVALGLLMLALGWAGAWLLWRRRGRELPRWFLCWSLWMTPAGFIATVAGWWTAETGRQPWVVYGLMRTADAWSPLTPDRVLYSFLAFIGIYAVVMWAYLYYLLKVIRKGPVETLPHLEIEHAPARHAFGGIENE
ncbi:MAG: cytochrome ubiquinol oxidase subunit I [Gammaproteobacteria bacterium]